MQIIVPAAGTSSHGRRPAGISPAASSISIAVTGITAPQIADISATSANCTASAAGRTCTIPVQAPVGSDVFTVTIFDGPNATGNQLSAGTAPTTVVPGIPFSVTITLAGVIHSLQFVTANSGGGAASPPPGPPGGPGTTNLDNSSVGPPVGHPGSVIGTVAALDASGNYIVGPYNTTVTITSSDPSVSVVPGTLTESGPLTFSYDGLGTNAVTLTASAAATASTPVVTTTKTITPSSSLSYYPTPTINPVWIYTGPDGKLYVVEFGNEGVLAPGGLVGGIGPSKIARFDPVSKTFTGEVTVGVGAISIAWAPDGSFFETNQNDNPATIGHVTGFSSYTPFTLPSSNFTGPRGLVLGSDGNMWFDETRGATTPRVPKVGKFNPASPGTMTEYNLPQGAGPQGIASGSDGNIYVLDRFNGAVDQVTPSGAVTAFPIPGAGAAFSIDVFPRFIAAGSDGNLWFTDLGNENTTPIGLNNGNLWKMTTSGVFTKISLPVTYSGADFITPGPAGTLYFDDLTLGGVGQVTTAGVVTDWQFLQNTCASSIGVSPNAVALGPDNSVWFATQSCVQLPANETQGFIGHLQLAAGWTAFPLDDTYYMAPNSTVQSQMLSMAESGDSSPFTITSSNPGVATVATTASTHTFVINAVANGTTLLTITDAQNRTLTKTVVVTSASANVQSARRRIQ
jgi:streptogramin lyase